MFKLIQFLKVKNKNDFKRNIFFVLSQTLEELYSGFCACRAILQVKNIYILLAEGPGDALGKKR